MAKHSDSRVYVPARSHPTLAWFEVGTARRGQTVSDCIGEAMNLWLEKHEPDLSK